MAETLYTRDILAELVRRNIRPVDISRNLELARSTVTRWINCQSPDNPLVRHYIASLLGRRPEDLRPGARPPAPDTEHSRNAVAEATSDYTGDLPRRAAGGGC